MPLRPTMLPLICYVRALVGEADTDACSCSSALSDDQIQSALDDTRVRIRYQRLEPLETIQPGGQVQWLEFESDSFFEDDAQLLDGNYTPIPADQIASFNALRGEYTFTQSRPLGILITGTRYDPYLAAANLLRSLRASNKLAVDSADANLKQSLSQMITNMAALEADYRRSARIGSITFCRSGRRGRLMMDLRCIRARAARQMMHQRAEVLVQTPTTDEFGSTSYTTAVSARWPCRVVHATSRPRDEMVADENQAKGEWHVLMPLAAQVGKGDRLRVVGQTYLVIDTDRGNADACYLLVYVKTER